MRAFISTGGKGKRLMPLTSDIPKPMVKLAGIPILERLVLWLKKYGIKEIVMMNGHMQEVIVDYFGDGSKLGVKIYHSNEPKPLGSGGPLRYARKYIEGRFVYLSGDIACKINLKKMIDAHIQASKNGAIMSVFLHESSHPEDSDILVLDKNKRVARFVSKHDDHTNAGNLGNAGISILEPEVIDYMEKDVFTYETYLYPRLLKAGEYIHGYVSDDFVKDIGTTQRLREVEKYYKEMGY
ncbi:MAG: Bifunctional protein GlmU [Candidatus Woesearchaeota archaeon]|nr:Bifunctional protein GlmU [Candidatus Woesearchaeota archaeon]